VDIGGQQCAPPDFAKIPPASLAGAVLMTVANRAGATGVNENSIAQTAQGAARTGRFTPKFDGAPQYGPIAGTSLVWINASAPVIQVATTRLRYAPASGSRRPT
jgi:hypothetical protein